MRAVTGDDARVAAELLQPSRGTNHAEPEAIADLLAYLGFRPGEVVDWTFAADGRRRIQRDLRDGSNERS